MSLKSRIEKLEAVAGVDAERWCRCPIEWVEVDAAADDDGPEPEPAPADPVPATCARCGLAIVPGTISFIEIRRPKG
jgi:hypothetical protein